MRSLVMVSPASWQVQHEHFGRLNLEARAMEGSIAQSELSRHSTPLRPAPIAWQRSDMAGDLAEAIARPVAVIKALHAANRGVGEDFGVHEHFAALMADSAALAQARI